MLQGVNGATERYIGWQVVSQEDWEYEIREKVENSMNEKTTTETQTYVMKKEQRKDK